MDGFADIRVHGMHTCRERKLNLSLCFALYLPPTPYIHFSLSCPIAFSFVNPFPPSLAFPFFLFPFCTVPGFPPSLLYLSLPPSLHHIQGHSHGYTNSTWQAFTKQRYRSTLIWSIHLRFCISVERFASGGHRERKIIGKRGKMRGKADKEKRTRKTKEFRSSWKGNCRIGKCIRGKEICTKKEIIKKERQSK